MQSNSALKLGDRLLGPIAFGLLGLHNVARRAVKPAYRSFEAPTQSPNTVVVIKLCCLGDALLAVPAIRALARRWPQSRLVLLCTPRSSPAFANLPFVDELISLPVTGLGDTWAALRRGQEVIGAVSKLRGYRAEVVVDLDLYFKTTPIIAYLTGAPVRAGFDTEGYNRAGLFTHAVPRDRDKWEAECFLDVVGAVGAPTDDRALEVHIGADVRQAADQILRARGLEQSDTFAVVCPGSSQNWPSKQWPSHRFAEVIDWLQQERGIPSVLVGASFEAGLCEEVASYAEAGVECLAGETTVAEMAAILQRSAVLVTNDTGPLHLGVAVGTPVVAIFGPTNERKWGPRGPRDAVIFNENCDCRPCYYLSYMPDCEHRRCLDEIPASRVINAVNGIVDNL